MPKPSKSAAPRAEITDTTKTHILSSLTYLAATCENEGCQNILLTTLDICVWCSTHEKDGIGQLPNSQIPRQQDGLVAALSFLSHEANRNDMGDFEIIIEAACTLIQYFLIHQKAREYLMRY